jgi:hypothetical protein
LTDLGPPGGWEPLTIGHATNENDPLARAGRAIRSFVENPVTNLVKGLLLLLIGLFEASHTFREDVAKWQPRVGHGLVIIGLFSVLDAVPRFLEGVEASKRYVESRKSRGAPAPGSGDGPGGREPDGDPDGTSHTG